MHNDYSGSFLTKLRLIQVYRRKCTKTTIPNVQSTTSLLLIFALQCSMADPSRNRTRLKMLVNALVFFQTECPEVDHSKMRSTTIYAPVSPQPILLINRACALSRVQYHTIAHAFNPARREPVRRTYSRTEDPFSFIDFVDPPHTREKIR